MTATPESALLPSVEDVTAISRDVWSCFVDREHALEAAPTSRVSGPGAVAAVDVSGAWNNTVMLAVPAHTVWEAACAMTSGCPGADEVHDALRELVNMIGGNIKSLMPAPSRLGAPRVRVTQDLLDATEAEPGLVVALDWVGRPFTVLIAPTTPQ